MICPDCHKEFEPCGDCEKFCGKCNALFEIQQEEEYDLDD